MIFNYSTGEFVEDGRVDRLKIAGLVMIVDNPKALMPVAFDAPAHPEEAMANVIDNVEFIFTDGFLKVMSGSEQLKDLSQLTFIMSESEGTIGNGGFGNNHSSKILKPEVKIALQRAIDQIAVENGIVLPANIDFFNDKFLLYMFPLLRNLTNASTNFYKILNDLKNTSNYKTDDDYHLTYELLQQRSVADAIRVHLGTSSKVLIKWMADKIIKKTDLVKSLSPELLDILIKHSGKIFGAIGQDQPEVKVLTCYEDVELELFNKLKFLMDVFQNNVDHVQTLIASDLDITKLGTGHKRTVFLKSHFTPKKIMNILQDDNYSSYVNDLINQFNTYSDPDLIPAKLRFEYPNGLELPKNWKTLKELHDKVSIDFNKIKAEDNNKTIPYTDVEWQLHGLKKDNVEFMLPSEASVLVAWGSEQHHCVASYADRAARKDCLIVGIKINGKHLYTMELRTQQHVKNPTEVRLEITPETINTLPPEYEYSYSIQQLHGYKNGSPEGYGDENLKKIVREMLSTVFTAKSGDFSVGISNMNQIADLQRALEAGNYNAAPMVPEPMPAQIDVPMAEAVGNRRLP